VTDNQRRLIIGGVVGTVALAGAMTAVAMTPGAVSGASSHKQQHMSALKVSGLVGYVVRDSDGREVGRVVDVQTDDKGRTRYVRAALNGGEDVRIAAFRAQLDSRGHAIDLTIPVAAVVNDPGALIAPAPEAARMVVASAGR
jgi:sporulation protein YlmC with PRC-barrel domain